VALFALAVFPGLARAQGPPAPDSTVVMVAKLEEARRGAMVAADLEALARLIDPDATYVHSNGLFQKRDQLLAMLARAEIRYVGFTVDSEEYRRYGSTVVGTGLQTIELTSSGNPFTSHSRFTVVYSTDGGPPRLVAYQSTPLPDVGPRERR
jgi:hypothetical protein